jgi:hypothetical protein
MSGFEANRTSQRVRGAELIGDGIKRHATRCATEASTPQNCFPAHLTVTMVVLDIAVNSTVRLYQFVYVFSSMSTEN